MVWEFNRLLNNHLIEAVDKTLGTQAGITPASRIEMNYVSIKYEADIKLLIMLHKESRKQSKQ